VGPSDEDVERARTLLRARWARRLEAMEGRAASLAGADTTTLGTRPPPLSARPYVSGYNNW